MALAVYSDLLSAVNTWNARTDLAGMGADFITMATARFNRVLGPIEVDTTLTGVVDSDVIDISALSMVEPIALFLAESGYDEQDMLPMAAGTFTLMTDSGRPSIWSINDENIQFDRPLNQAYPFRFRYVEKLVLNDTTNTTNWLLTNHPDVYLAGVLVWSGAYTRKPEFALTYKAILEEGIAEISHLLTQQRRGVLVVDPMLQTFGRGWNDWTYST